MRISLNKIKETEDFLFEKMDPGSSLLFKAKLLLDPFLNADVLLQKRTYMLVRYYGRKKLKDEIEAVHSKIFNDPTLADFQQNIHELFSKQDL